MVFENIHTRGVAVVICSNMGISKEEQKYNIYHLHPPLLPFIISELV